MRYWDSSALVPLVVQQARSADLRTLIGGDPDIATSWLSVIECWSALARLVREGLLSHQGERTARSALVSLAGSITEIPPTEECRQEADVALHSHSLTAGDALQLASALVWAEGKPVSRQFVCLDTRLSEAARAEGFTIVPGDRD